MQIKRIALGGIIMTVIMLSGCSTTEQNLAIGEEKTLKTGKIEQESVTAKTWLNIREKPDVNSEDLGDLPAGTVITVDKIENGWAHFEGYCSAQWLKQ